MTKMCNNKNRMINTQVMVVCRKKKVFHARTVAQAWQYPHQIKLRNTIKLRAYRDTGKEVQTQAGCTRARRFGGCNLFAPRCLGRCYRIRDTAVTHFWHYWWHIGTSSGGIPRCDMPSVSTVLVAFLVEPILACVYVSIVTYLDVPTAL